jgi:hypothetical protein
MISAKLNKKLVIKKFWANFAEISDDKINNR